MAFDSYLRARGVVYEPENHCIMGRPCVICGRDLSHNLTNLDEQERAVWLRLNDWVRAGWEAKRRTGRPPEVSDEWVRLEKWMRRRSRAADERVFGKHCHAAVIFGYRRAKELFPFAAEWADEAIRAHEEAGTGDLYEPPPDESKWK
jgi:hypothetical protein